MEKRIFMNGSPNKSGNTFKIGEEILKGVNHEILQMSDYKVYQYGKFMKMMRFIKFLKPRKCRYYCNRSTSLLVYSGRNC